MSTEKMREEFEAVLREDCEASGIDAPDLRVSPCVLDDGALIYTNDTTQACWWAYRKGWQASRAAIEVKLPRQHGLHYPRMFTDEVRESIESLGLRVKQS